MLISVDYLKSILRYNENDGCFYWVNSRRGVTAGQKAGSDRGDGYIEIKIDKKKYLAHRLVWFYVHGVVPQQLDHKNRDKADNRLSNLRLATSSQNMANRVAMPNNRIGLKGVSKNGSGFRAVIKKNRKFIHIGTFRTPEEAFKAYMAAADKLFGEFARAS